MNHALLPHDHGQNIESILEKMPTNKEFTKTTDGSGAYVSISAFTNKVIV